jgi:hypothetical protein
MGQSKVWCPTRIHFGSLALSFINDLPNSVNDKSKPILFADDTSIIVTNSNPKDYVSGIMTTFECLSKWFQANSFSLNYDKTYFLQFTTKNGPHINFDVNYASKTISKAYNTKFLVLHIDSTLSWKLHIEQVLHTLSAACYALISLKPYMSLETMKMVCNAYIHSAMSYGIICWGNYG